MLARGSSLPRIHRTPCGESPPRRRGNPAVAEAEAGDSHGAAGAGEEARRQRSRHGRKVRIGGDERVVEKKMW
jgi:hypothetical protein